MTAHSRLTHAAFLLLGLAGTSSAILLNTKTSQSQQMSAESLAPTPLEVMHTFRSKILVRFDHVDADSDGKVSLAELRSGFGHEPAHVGEGLLREMMAECAGGDSRALFCTQEQMRDSLDEWVNSHSARTAMTLLQMDSESGFRRVSEHGESDGEMEEEAQQPCGPSVAAGRSGLEGVKCLVHGPRCVARGALHAWSLNSICRGASCICEATAETKRLAKLGLTGAAAVTTAINFTDPDDVMLDPDCGSDWKSTKVVGRLEDVHGKMNFIEEGMAKAALSYLAPKSAKSIHNTTFADTEVGVFRSDQQELVKGDRTGKVCMFSWQATRSTGDWILNALINEIPFKYAPKGVSVTAPKGLVISYDTVRPKLLKVFEEQCCAPGDEVDKVVISGHSHGGAMAELHAIDAVTTWKCNGRDLGAKNMAVVLVAPHTGMLSSQTINKVFSCEDPAQCLPGSVVTIVTHGDFVGDMKMNVRLGAAPKHPSHVSFLPCPPIPAGADYSHTKHYDDFWCHGMFNYVGQVEELLVGKAGWGSTCGGSCGNPNRMVQCNQWAVMALTGCSYANSSWLKTPTQCPSSWVPEEERCACHFDLCTDLTRHGCTS